jgi:hypothetical protein
MDVERLGARLTARGSLNLWLAALKRRTYLASTSAGEDFFALAMK